MTALRVSRAWIGEAALLLVLWLSLVSLPWPVNEGLDASWQAVLVYAHAHGWQFGTQIVFTWGPWGFLCSEFHLGALGAVQKLLWETAGKLGLAFALLRLLREFPLWRRVLVVCAWVFLTDYILDVSFLMVISLVVIGGLMRRTLGRGDLLLWMALLAGLSQLKFTYTVLAVVGSALASAVWISRREPGKAAAIVALYIGLWFLGWFSAGQGTSNLVPYFRRSWEVATGYGDAMGLDETTPVFLLAVSTLVVCGVFILHVLRKVEDRGLAWGASAFLAAVWILVWKEAITRGDDHVFSLFFFTVIAAVTFPFLLFPGKRGSWFEAVCVLCLVGSYQVNADHLWGVIRLAPGRLAKSARDLAHVGTLPETWEKEFRAAAQASALPRVREAVGSRSVDVFNFYQGAALLNGLSYSPRPVFQGYSAYTPGLSGCNLRFYQSASQPVFLLWNADRVDNRFPTLDDSFLWQSWLGHYQPVLHEGRFELLRRTSAIAKTPPTRRGRVARTMALGETLTLPEDRTHAMGLALEAIPTARGRLRGLLYKPALLTVVTTEADGRVTSWRLLPRLAAGGFLLSPFAETDADLVALLGGRGRRWVTSIRFEAPAGQEADWKAIDVGLYELSDTTVTAESPYLSWVEAGIVVQTPEKVTSVAAAEFFTVGGQSAGQLHAPGELVLPIPAGARRLTGDFGIREGAYTGVGRTDGVAFTIDLVHSDGTVTALWERFLNPLGVAGDRGLQHVAVALPAGAAGSIRIRTGPGPANDNRWDWAYLSQVRFDSESPAEKAAGP